MRQPIVNRLEHRKSIFMLLITFVVVLIALTKINGFALSRSGAGILEPQATIQESKQTEIRELRLGEPIERDLGGGGSHFYSLTLSFGQYMHVVVEQKGADVVVTLFAPDGRKLGEMDSPDGTRGPEPVSAIAEAAGSYRLEVKVLNENPLKRTVIESRRKKQLRKGSSLVRGEQQNRSGKPLRSSTTR